MSRVTARRPILILRHAACNEAGYLCRTLDRLEVGYRKVCVDRGESALEHIEAVAGMILLGAPVSVYDPLPWIAAEIDWVRTAAEHNVPMLGICFGAQLMSAALGGSVCKAPSMQVGWHPVHTLASAAAHPLLADLPLQFDAFEWHGDTFTPPPQATPLFRGGCIEQQGFLLGDSLAVQFHPEVTAAQIESWIGGFQHCLPAPSDCVQSVAEITRDLNQRLQRQRAVTDRLLYWWLSRMST